MFLQTHRGKLIINILIIILVANLLPGMKLTSLEWLNYVCFVILTFQIMLAMQRLVRTFKVIY